MTKTITVISDLHLTNHFYPKKYALIREIIQDADQVVINGDFWESYACTFDQFVNSPWNKLFPLLKAKDTVYLFGNHDPENLADKRTELFSNYQGVSWETTLGGTLFHFEHGNRIVPLPDPPIPRSFRKVLPTIEAHGLLRQQTSYLLWYRIYNRKMVRWAKKNLPAGAILVSGHSHLAAINISKQFANSGCIKWRVATWLTINDGAVKLHSSRY